MDGLGLELGAHARVGGPRWSREGTVVGVEGGLEFERDQWGDMCGMGRGREAAT